MTGRPTPRRHTDGGDAHGHQHHAPPGESAPRGRSRRCRVGTALLAAFARCLVAGEARADEARAVTIRVYDTAGLSDRVRQDAQHGATRALEAAGLAPVWRLCGRTRADAACASALAAGELSVRIVRSDDRAAHAGEHLLGTAVIDTAAGAGLLATVYADRVAELARAARAETATLLGRAIAHEIGHLLMASSRHAADGLMRAVWRARDIREGREADWTFLPDDVTAMAARAGDAQAR